MRGEPSKQVCGRNSADHKNKETTTMKQNIDITKWLTPESTSRIIEAYMRSHGYTNIEEAIVEHDIGVQRQNMFDDDYQA